MSRSSRIVIYILMAVAAVIIGSIAIIKSFSGEDASTQDHIDLGRVYLLEFSYEEAIMEFTEAIEIEPMNVEDYLGLAEAYEGLDDVPKAIEVLEKGIEKTEDEKLKIMLERLMKENAAAINDIMEVAAEPYSNETLEFENEIIAEAAIYAQYINNINSSANITIYDSAEASIVAIDNPELLYTPQYFLSYAAEIPNKEVFSSCYYYNKVNSNIREFIMPYSDEYNSYFFYSAFKLSQYINLYDRILDGTIHITENNLYALDSSSGYGPQFFYLVYTPVFFDYNSDLNYDIVNTNDGLIYNTIDDSIGFSNYLYGEDFKCFYKKSIVQDYGVIFEFWVDISENSYTYYHISPGSN